MLRVEPGGGTLLQGLRGAGVLLESPCNGKGLCGKCKVRVLSGAVSPPGERELAFLSPRERAEGVRLACMAAPLGPVELDPLSLLGGGEGAVLGGGEMPPIRYAPAVTAEAVAVSPPTLENGLPLSGAFGDCLLGPDCPPLPLVRKLPGLTGAGAVQAVRRHGRLLDLRTDEHLLGIAVDIGTTTVAISLLDLRTGAALAEDGFVNPQKAFGLDVLSRIHYDMEHPGGVLELQRAIAARLQRSAEALAQAAGVPLDAVYEVVVGGNATMVHALLGVPLASLGRAPYSSVFTRAMEVPANALGLALNPEAVVYCVPAVSTYIGGDIVAGALCARLDEAQDTVLFLDIGTNGEMILSRGGVMYACSCAAGPALEGMNISCGMRAGPGAVEHVRLEEDSARLEVIGGGEPRGLCGSGLLEAVGQAVRRGAVAKSGRIAAGHPLTGEDGAGKRRIVLDAARGICLTQNDIRQVQLCKGAILSGILTLLERLSLAPEDVDRVVVAGQFGKHLDPASLTDAGLIPAALGGRISYIGNASKTGAGMCLLSTGERQRAEAIARCVTYLELSVSPGYEKLFTKSLQFGGV